jgi:hypothetical protein
MVQSRTLMREISRAWRSCRGVCAYHCTTKTSHTRSRIERPRGPVLSQEEGDERDGHRRDGRRKQRLLWYVITSFQTSEAVRYYLPSDWTEGRPLQSVLSNRSRDPIKRFRHPSTEIDRWIDRATTPRGRICSSRADTGNCN